MERSEEVPVHPPAALPSADGFVLLHERADGIYLTVFPPIGEGRRVTVGDVRRRIEEYGARAFDMEAVRTACAEASGTPVRIATLAAPPPPVPADDAAEAIRVSISEDGLRAFLTYEPAEGSDPGAEARRIYRALEAAGVTHGIRRALIEEVAASRVPVTDLVVAEGAPPVPGRDGRIEFHFDPDPAPAPPEKPDGRVDFRERHLVQNVEAGTVLLRVEPETAGSPGIRVDGRMVLATPGKPPPGIRPGPGVRLLADGRTFEAETAGHATLRGDLLVVEPVFVCDDVDYETGNIEMEGAVVVRGTVRAGFSVRATGDIEVLGAIEGAEVVSREGSVWVHGGIAGGGKGVVRAAKDVAARFIERARVTAGRNAAVEDSILDAEVTAGRAVRALTGRGQVVGGIVRAAERIRVRVAGAPAGPATELRIEPMEAPRLYARLSELEAKILAADAERERIERLLAVYPRDAAGAERAIRALEAAREELDRRRRLHLAERAGIHRRLAGTGGGVVEVDEAVHENVLVVIGRTAHRVRMPRGSTRFFREGGILRWK